MKDDMFDLHYGKRTDNYGPGSAYLLISNTLEKEIRPKILGLVMGVYFGCEFVCKEYSDNGELTLMVEGSDDDYTLNADILAYITTFSSLDDEGVYKSLSITVTEEFDID